MGKSFELVDLAVIGAITVLLAVVVFGIYNRFKGSVDNTVEQGVDVVQQMDESRYTSHDGETIKGSTVKSLLQDYSSDDVSIAVKTNSSSGYAYFNYASSITDTTDTAEVDFTSKITTSSGSNYANVNAVNKKTNGCYVNPGGDFEVHIVRNANGSIVGVVFTQQ